jgi:hypothetical protein
MDDQMPLINQYESTTNTRQRVSQLQQAAPDAEPISAIKIRETSPDGTHLATHHISANGISTTPAPSKSPSTNPSASIIIRLLTPFLPNNYPNSVTADYTPYQIYDSLQAFASTIASLLASRAVLISVGVGGDDPSSTATAATLLSIVQNNIGQATSILFAYRFALRIEAEVKFYRFLADIVNDTAFVLDVLSPSLPAYARVPALCTASACRAICGVCGGSSKAILSAHFAKAGNIGELNAKDGSQETVVSLVGMWVGGLLVKKVTGKQATLIWMLVLLVLHLWTNWQAVRSVRLRTLNRERAGIVIERLMEGRNDVDVEAIGDFERIFASGGVMRCNGVTVGYCSFGSVSEFFKHIDPTSWTRLLGEFRNEKYLLWLDQQNDRCVILLKEDANGETQIKAWFHAFRVVQKARKTTLSADAVMNTLEKTLLDHNKEWASWKSQLQADGWDLESSNLTFLSGSRIQVQIVD